jgi:hypothetical protein
LASIILIAGCALPTIKAYDGQAKPEYEVVTVFNSSRFAFWSFTDIYSIDGLLLYQPASSMVVLPGAHCYQVVVTRRSKSAMLFLQDSFYEEAICGFKLEAAPGTTYVLGPVNNGGQLSTDEHNVYIAFWRLKSVSPMVHP